MTYAYSPNAILRDVTLRDGLQLTGKLLSTERKVDIARQLIALGVPELEIGSMARGDLVPPMANTLEVISELTPEELERCWVWVATPRHIEKAAAAGARKFQYCLSASDKHNQANIGRSTEASLAAFPDAVRNTEQVGGTIELCIATAFTCPFDGEVPLERVIAIADDPRTDGAADLVLCDTLGQAVPTQVTRLFERRQGTDPAAPHGVSRSRHVGAGRRQHPGRHQRGCRHGRRLSRRARGLPVRSRRQRQHLHRGSAVRHPTRSGSLRTSSSRWSGSPTKCSPNSANPIVRRPPRARVRKPTHSRG